MFAFIFGILLILAGGLANREDLLARQDSLKHMLHHLSVYQSSIGLMNMICGLITLMHAIFTSTAHTYAPLYWVAYAMSAYLAFVLGVTLSFEYLQRLLMKVPSSIHRLFAYIQLWTEERVSSFSWYAMTLGVWKIFDVLVGVK
jgi:hypothetical protein